MIKDIDPSLRFGFLVHDVSRLRRVVVDRALKPLGMTRAQWQVIAFLSRRDGMKQNALAADLELTKVAVGRLLDRVEAAGLIARRADSADARARRVYLTRQGARMVATIRDSVERVELAILNRVSVEDLTQAAATLHEIKYTLIEMLDGETADLGDPTAGIDDEAE